MILLLDQLKASNFDKNIKYFENLSKEIFMNNNNLNDEDYHINNNQVPDIQISSSEKKRENNTTLEDKILSEINMTREQLRKYEVDYAVHVYMFNNYYSRKNSMKPHQCHPTKYHHNLP